MRIKAKDLSMTAKIVGSLFILFAMTMKGYGKWSMDISEVTLGVLGMIGLFAPVDMSMYRKTKDKAKSSTTSYDPSGG